METFRFFFVFVSFVFAGCTHCVEQVHISIRSELATAEHSVIVVVVVVVNAATVIESEADNMFECIWYSLRLLATLLLVSRSGAHAGERVFGLRSFHKEAALTLVWHHNVHIDRKPKWI